MPSTLIRRHLRGMLMLLASFVLLLASAGPALAQDATPEASPVATGDGPVLGDAVVLFDDRGNEVAQVAVLNLTDPFEETTSNPQRGSRYVAIEVVIQNLSDDDTFEANPFDIRMIDGEGTLYTSAFVSRDQEARAQLPDLASVELEAGAATSGIIVYEVIDEAAPALVTFTNVFESFTLLADLREAVPAEGEATTIYDDQGEELGTISLDETLPALEDEDEAFDASRGETVLGAVVTVENTSDDDVEIDAFSMYVVDEFGFLYGSNSFFRDEEESSDLPADLPSDPIAAGDSVTGLVAFTLPNDVVPSYVLYVPGGSQLFVVAQPGEGSVISGDTLTPVPVPVDDTDEPIDDDTDEPVDDGSDEGDDTVELSAECTELQEWATATEENLAVLDESPVFQAESPADVSTDDLRDAAAELSDAAEAQADLDVPEAAADANEAVIALLEEFAAVLEDGADQIDDGADAEEVFSDELIAEDSELGQAIEDLATAGIDLQTACPDVDFSLF